MDDKPLYPPIEPFASFSLSVGDGHHLHVEVSGCPDGLPVVVLHGGPGAGCRPDLRRFFDARRYRIILYDQRGAGRSRPLGCVTSNTTAALIADLETLRQHLDVERWMLFGGSWGSTLALAYGGAHPNRVAAAVLRGVWLARPEDIRWLTSDLRRVVPDHWRELAEVVAPDERGDLVEAYWRRLDDPDPAVRRAAAIAWRRYERRCGTLLPEAHPAAEEETLVVALARIETHYFRNGCFLDPASLLAGAARMWGTPAAVVHGRYDFLAPLDGAFAVAAAWPDAELHVVPGAGHSVFETGIRARLIDVTTRFAELPPWR